MTAIDNLPSLMPVESSQDYAAQLLPSLLTLTELDAGVWGRAKAEFDRHIAGVKQARKFLRRNLQEFSKILASPNGKRRR